MKVCLSSVCDLQAKVKGYCNGHYRRVWDGKDPNILLQPKGYERAPCLVPNCKKVRVGNGYCKDCNRRWRENGGPLASVRERHSCVDANGYERWNKGHPRNIWNAQVFAHRAEMELYLGRELFPNENVHHVNGDRLDNRLENLELWNTSQPPGQRVEDKLRWAEELLRQYGRVSL